MKNKQKNIKTTSTIGGRICKLRFQAGLSQENLAEKLGVSSTRISRIESGDIELRCWEVEEMCELFKVTADYIVRGIEITPVNLELTPEEKKLLRNLLEKLEIC